MKRNNNNKGFIANFKYSNVYFPFYLLLTSFFLTCCSNVSVSANLIKFSHCFFNKIMSTSDIATNLENSSEPSSEDSSSSQLIISAETEPVQEKQNPDHGKDSLEAIIRKEEEETDEAKVSSSKNPIRDDVGFETPTSSDHKIPVPAVCPPAPRKTRPPLLKRKASSPPRSRRRLQFNEPPDVDLIFGPVSSKDDDDKDNVEEEKIKKARTDGED